MCQSTALVPRQPAFSGRTELTKRPGLPFAEYLPGSLVNSMARRLGHTFRQRLFTPAITLWTFLSQVLDENHSCGQAVKRLVAYLFKCGRPLCSVNTGAYCKARARLPEALLKELTRSTGRQLLEQSPGDWLWKGHAVKVVDGTGISMPDTPANHKTFSKLLSSASGVGMPVLRLVVVFSLAVGTVLEAAFGACRGKRTGELALLREVADQFRRGDVLLGDRIYCSYWNLAQAVANGYDVVARMHGSREPVWFKGHRADNRRVWWKKPDRPEWMGVREYRQVAEWLCLRAVRVNVTRVGFRSRRLVVITTLLDAKVVTGNDIAELYRRRWQAELYLRSIKQTLKMDLLRGHTPDMIRKEIWAHLLVYNLVRTVMAKAATQDRVRPDEISFAGALQSINAFLPDMRAVRTTEEAHVLWEVILWVVSSNRVGKRPNRYEPREVKRGHKSYPHMKVSRKEARKQMRERVKCGSQKS